MRLQDLCPFCEREHAPRDCDRAGTPVAWSASPAVEAAAAEGDPGALADLLTYRFHAPVRAVLERVREDTEVLSSLVRDLDQERRYAVGRHLIAAGRALRAGRTDTAATELGSAALRARGDPKVSLLDGYLKLRAGDVSAAVEALEAATMRTEPGGFRAGLRFMLGRARMVDGELARGEERFRQALDEAVPPLRSELLYQIARLRLAAGPAPAADDLGDDGGGDGEAP